MACKTMLPKTMLNNKVYEVLDENKTNKIEMPNVQMVNDKLFKKIAEVEKRENLVIWSLIK